MELYSFDFLKNLSFTRTSGSDMELKAANIIKNECERLGAKASIEEFDVDGANVMSSSLIVDGVEYECVGVPYSSSTDKDGITGEFKYITNYNDARISDLKGKICLVHQKLISEKLYKVLASKGVSGIIMSTGSLYLSDEDVDLDPYMYRERNYKYGFIPAVCIRMSSSELLIRSNPKSVTLKVSQEHLKCKSHNVVCRVEGYTDDIVTFSAHYDSVSYSAGVYDNATGSCALFDLLKYYINNKPKRTVEFIWCGSEEVGLLGSKAYNVRHEEELKKCILNINFDMLGCTIGEDYCCVTAEKSLLSFIKYYSLIEGFPMSYKCGVYPSDSTSFADKGIPAITLARLSPKGGAEIHSHRDVIDFLSEDNYYRSVEFAIKLSSYLINSACFPVEREIPEDLKKELDYYTGRKERKSE